MSISVIIIQKDHIKEKIRKYLGDMNLSSMEKYRNYLFLAVYTIITFGVQHDGGYLS